MWFPPSLPGTQSQGQEGLVSLGDAVLLWRRKDCNIGPTRQGGLQEFFTLFSFTARSIETFFMNLGKWSKEALIYNLPV